MTGDIYSHDLDKTPANHIPLSPLSFIQRAARVYPDHDAVIQGSRSFTWAETFARCRRLASALEARGIGKGDTVALMLPNVTAFYEAFFGVIATGAVLNPLNYRLEAESLAFILNHGEAKVLLTDTEFAAVMRDALARCDAPPLVIDVEDPDGPGGERIGEIEYEAFLDSGSPDHPWRLPDDEWDAATLSYTSGTTDNPKGVVADHRGQYLLAFGNVISTDMVHNPVYLWTLPMFHANGWCYPYSMALMGGTNICLRKIDPGMIYRLIDEHKVTHLCAAPTVVNMIVNASDEERRRLNHTVRLVTGGSSPPAAIISRMEQEGFDVIHIWGMTELMGAATYSSKHHAGPGLSAEARAQRLSRQGMHMGVEEDVMIADPATLEPVPMDGETMGELMIRSNMVMRGYLKNAQATEDSLRGGWMHSGDLGVWHQDGCIELRDRAKDMIISGGENISTIEVEDFLHRHPAILEAAVVGKPDDHWGEVPCAFVTLKPGETASPDDIIQFCRDGMAHFKCPKLVVFEDLPKTATGKVQKFVLRERAKEA
ncbi:MAG: long-chain-fatty-acid--CoA ligase [Hyphomicrobiales bacterium]